MSIKEKAFWALYVLATIAVMLVLVYFDKITLMVLAWLISGLLCYCITATQALKAQDKRIANLQRLLSERERIMKSLSDKVSDLMRQIKKKKYNNYGRTN
jgi:peptidoglycan hydrolase CwlO-like protein